MAKRSKNVSSTRGAARTDIAGTKPDAQTGAFDWKWVIQFSVIALAVFWVFWPARMGQWIGDDSIYITANPLLNDPARLWKAWFQPGSFVEYYPIEQSMQWIQWQLWHNNTLGYHLTNIALHLASALLAWRLFSKLGLRQAWLGGLIFAVHPMMVDSVALVNEFKTALSQPPFLFAMCFYLDYERKGRQRDYWLAFGWFVVAMLCKITMAPFPLVILLFAWWKRDRIGWADLLASAPFFAVSLALSATAIWTGIHYGQHHQLYASALGGFFYRMVLVGQTTSFYFSRCFLPITPLPIYPKWSVDPGAVWQFLPWPILAGTIGYLWTKRRSWGRNALFGLGFFLIMLAPFLGAIPISYMHYSWVLEHLLYIPILGLVGLVIAALAQLDDKVPQPVQIFGRLVVVTAILLLAFQSHNYAGRYVDEETLSIYTIEHNPRSPLPYNSLGNALLGQGKVDEAIAQYQTGLEMDPNDGDIHYNLANALLQKGKNDEAIAQYQMALKSEPNNAHILYNFGNALLQKGWVEQAIDQYQKAVEMEPSHAAAHLNLGNVLLQLGRLREAIPQFQQSLEINPDDAEAHHNLGLALVQSGRLDEAIDQYQKAIKIFPNYAKAHNNLGNALVEQGRLNEAIVEFRMAVGIDPGYSHARSNLGTALWQRGQEKEAIAQFQEVVRLNPNDGNAQKILAQAIARENAEHK